MDATNRGQTVALNPNSTNLAEVIACELASRRSELVDNGVNLLLTYKAPQWLEQTAGLPPAAVRAYVRQQLASPECADFRRPAGSPPPQIPGPSAAPQLGRIGDQIAAFMRGRGGSYGADSAPGLAGTYR